MNFKQIEESILNDLNGGIDEIINEMEKSNKGHIKNHEQTKVQSMRQEPQLPTRMSPSESSLGWDDIFNTFNLKYLNFSIDLLIFLAFVILIHKYRINLENNFPKNAYLPFREP